MSLRSFVTVVASLRPRLGKTFLARMLCDFHLHDGRNVAAFDLNADDSALSQFMPGHSAPADVTNINGQMALFDRLIADDGAHKVVDLGHEAFKDFFKVAHDIGFAAEARQRGAAMVVLFIASDDAAASEAYAALRRDFPQAIIVPVHNEFLGSAQHRDKFPSTGSGSAMVHLPALAPGLRRITERKPFSFVDTRGGSPDIALETHIELQRWLRRVFLEFRELELRVLLSDLQSSIQVQS